MLSLFVVCSAWYLFFGWRKYRQLFGLGESGRFRDRHGVTLTMAGVCEISSEGSATDVQPANLSSGGTPLAILAVQHIRRMRGGAQSHLMLGEDENAYIVKFQNNPQHPRILVNELLATRLAESLGLTVPFCDVIEVTDWLINNTEALDFDLGPRRERCKAGLCFGSRMVGGLMPGHQLDFLSDEHLAIVKNIHEFAGILAFDKWTCNADGRQAVFTGKPQERRYSATFIDFGYCFNAGEWVFRDSPLRGVYGRTLVYKGITGWESFHPWISLIEEMSATVIWEAAQSIPPEWYLEDASSLEDLVERLIRRQRRVRDLISDFRESRHNPFPRWENRAQSWMSASDR